MVVAIVQTKGLKNSLTERRKPIAAKITPAGGYTCKINVRVATLRHVKYVF
jgi:hypothetical protein